jgi:hypothetical protein
MLDYLTVFRSRVGIGNVVLPLVGLTATRSEATLRKLRQVLDERVEIDVGDPASQSVFEYLAEKQLIGAKPRKSGRYSRYVLSREAGGWEVRSSTGEPLTTLPVFRTDTWFCDPRLRSTVGLPTPDNSEEAYEFVLSLGLVSKAKGARTAEGQTQVAMRGLLEHEQNPFALGLESALLLRQIIDRDALMLSELGRELASHGEQFRRDDLIPDGVVAIARRAYEAASNLRMRPEDVTQARTFLRLVEETATKKARARQKAATSGRAVSEGPGVLEHRLSPRLEWLTDFGILTKEGLPKNSFSYQQTPMIHEFVERLIALLAGELTAEDVALTISAKDGRWQDYRRDLLVDSWEEALLAGYKLIQMSIGPVPIREVSFLAAMHLDPAPLMAELESSLLRWAERDKGIRLTGGRYRRGPEMVHFSSKAFP